MRALLLAFFVAAGCSPDPCAGVMGICVTARVEGNVGALDQLNIAVAGVGARNSPVTPSGTFNLPVKLGI